MRVFNTKNYLMGRKNQLVTLFIIIFFFMLYLYKNKSNMVEKIFDYTDKYCRVNEECVVNMTNVTPFEWDYMYVIGSRQNLKSDENFINLKTGLDLDFSLEDLGLFRHIMFTKDNKLVHYEDYFYDPDTSGNKALLLNFDAFQKGIKAIKYYIISKENSKVLIKKETVPNHQEYRDYYWFSYANENQVVRGNVAY